MTAEVTGRLALVVDDDDDSSPADSARVPGSLGMENSDDKLGSSTQDSSTDAGTSLVRTISRMRRGSSGSAGIIQVPGALGGSVHTFSNPMLDNADSHASSSL